MTWTGVLRRGLAGAVIASAWSFPAWPQQVGGDAAAEREPYQHISNGGLNHSLSAFVVYGQPFAAEQVAKKGRTLNDGTNIVHFGHHAIFRDSQGRVRVEQPCGCAPDHEQMVEVYVMDPTAGTLTSWRTGGGSPKEAKVSPWKPKTPETVEAQGQAQAQARRVMASSRPQPRTTTEELKPELLDGIPARVVKVTTVVPAGRSGNDRDITKTHTAWIADDLHLVLMEQWEDPRDGVRTVGLAQFGRKEPNPALFYPPAGYSVTRVEGR